MKKIVLVAVFMLPLCGCEMLSEFGAGERPLVAADVNDVNAVGTGIAASGQGIAAVGTALGRPEIVGFGLALVAIGGIIAKIAPDVTKKRR